MEELCIFNQFKILSSSTKIEKGKEKSLLSHQPTTCCRVPVRSLVVRGAFALVIFLSGLGLCQWGLRACDSKRDRSRQIPI
jgi:hypothetical protein